MKEQNKSRMKFLAIGMLFTCAGVSANEWNFNEEDFNKDGQVKLKTTSGQAINIDNSQSANAFSISNSPTVINSNSRSISNSKAMGVGKKYSVSSSEPDAGRMSFVITEDCPIGMIDATAYYKYKSSTGGGSTTYSRYRDILVEVDSKKHLIFSPNNAAGHWAKEGTTDSFGGSGEFYFPKGSRLEISVENSTCGSDACSHYARLFLSCLIPSY